MRLQEQDETRLARLAPRVRPQSARRSRGLKFRRSKTRRHSSQARRAPLNTQHARRKPQRRPREYQCGQRLQPRVQTRGAVRKCSTFTAASGGSQDIEQTNLLRWTRALAATAARWRPKPPRASGSTAHAIRSASTRCCRRPRTRRAAASASCPATCRKQRGASRRAGDCSRKRPSWTSARRSTTWLASSCVCYLCALLTALVHARDDHGLGGRSALSFADARGGQALPSRGRAG